MVDHLVEGDIRVLVEPLKPLQLKVYWQCPCLRWSAVWSSLYALKFFECKALEFVPLHQFMSFDRIGFQVGGEDSESGPEFGKQMMERSKNVLQSEAMDC